MIRRSRLASAVLYALGLVVLLLIFLAWRQGGLALLQLDRILC